VTAEAWYNLEAPAAHRSPVTKPTKPKASRPAKPTRPKTHEKHEAPTRHKGGTDKKGKKEAPKKSAGLEERDVVEFDGGALLHVPSLGALPN
jgi:hypothetical protein